MDRDSPSDDEGAPRDQDAEVTPSDDRVEPRDGAPDSSQTTDDSGQAEPDGGAREVPILHPACDWPAVRSIDSTKVLVKTDARGRPGFDWWRDLTCQQASHLETCTQDVSGRSATCLACVLGTPDSGVGLCSSDAIPVLCDFEPNHAVAGMPGQGCVLCGDLRLRKRACCEQLAGFDCRAWPYPANTGPGQPCARHGDCEPGLMCRIVYDRTYGICSCPETVSAPVVPCAP